MLDGHGQVDDELRPDVRFALHPDLTAVVTDPNSVAGEEEARFSCDAPDDELLLVDWLHALIYEMARDHMVFGRFEVILSDHHLEATAWGEQVQTEKHTPAVEVKGATYTELRVEQVGAEGWVAQCVVDV